MSSVRLTMTALLLVTVAFGCAPDNSNLLEDLGPGGKADWTDSAEAIERERAVGRLLEGLRDQPVALSDFVLQLPKGADLHSHLVGAVRTESLIRWGGEDGLCLDTAELTAVKGPCEDGKVPLSDVTEGSDLYDQTLKSWSMAGMQSAPVAERHKHFFDSFLKFGPVTWKRSVDMLVEVRRKAADQNLGHLELMMSLASYAGGKVGERLMDPADLWDATTLEQRQQEIVADSYFNWAMNKALNDLDGWEQEVSTRLGCETATPEPACDVQVRYIVQASRTNSREYVFGQFVYAFEMVQRSDRVVGLNLVQAEEDPSSLANYDDEMLGLDVLYWANRNDANAKPVHIALHAGELTPDLLPDTPEGQRHLTYHIRAAVEIGHAERIGHGVALESEDDSAGLRSRMANDGVMVEICLSSNEALLGVSGAAHPLATYARSDVPVAMATDDEGILRTSISSELLWAVQVNGLDYRTLKRSIRDSLRYSFLPGERLQSDASCRASLQAESLEDDCAAFIAESPKAAAQWKLEEKLDQFEKALVD